MNKFIKLFICVDLFLGLTLITSFISKIIFIDDDFLLVFSSLGFALANLVVSIFISKKFNFYKKANEYVKK